VSGHGVAWRIKPLALAKRLFLSLYAAKQPELWHLIPKNTIVTVSKGGEPVFDRINYHMDDKDSVQAKGVCNFSLTLSKKLNPVVPPPTD
jgi:hypothetical protein